MLKGILKDLKKLIEILLNKFFLKLNIKMVYLIS